MADREQELAAKIEAIRKLAAENQGVDEKALIESLLAQNTSRESLPTSQVVRGYLISLLLPPFGLYYAVKFWLRGEPAARKAAWICFALTIFALGLLWWSANAIFSSPPLQSIQNITPGQIQELTQ